MDYYKIGQRIRQLRKARGLSQEQLAEQIGISVTHMSHIETGSTKLSLPVMADLAKAIDASTDELLFGFSEQPKNMAINDILSLLDSCSATETKILSRILQSAKQAMDDYL